MRQSFAFLLIFLLLSVAARAGEPVGSVQEITGHATILHAGGGAPQQVVLHAPVFGHDVVEAGDDAHVTLKFADETVFVISGKGRFTVDDYIFDPKEPDAGKSVFSILGAAFSYAGGAIDKGVAHNATLNLDYGSIGIRGTKILGALANGSDWLYLAEGKVTVDNDGGEVILSPGDGTSMTGKAAAPVTPYAFTTDEIAWIQKLVDDPAARTNPAMAAAAPSSSRARSNVAANDATSRRAADAPGAAAPPSEPSAPASASAPAAPAAEAAPPPTPAAPAEVAAVQAVPPAVPKGEPPLAGKMSAATINAEPPGSIISLSSLSAASLGTRIAQDGPGIVRIDTQTPTTINIAVADVASEKLENAVLHYSAMLKAKDLAGMAYLEMWVHFPGVKGGNFFSHGLDHPLNKSEDWKTFQTPFLLKPGQLPDKVTLNLVINGHGTVWIKDVRLTR